MGTPPTKQESCDESSWSLRTFSRNGGTGLPPSKTLVRCTERLEMAELFERGSLCRLASVPDLHLNAVVC